MKYKMIVCDFDGTLCCRDNTLSEKNVQAVRDYLARGGIFVINSGRMNKSVRKYEKQLGIDVLPLSIAGFQGGYIVDNSGKTVVKEAIDCQTSIKIIEHAEKLGLYVHTYDAEDVLIEKAHPIADQYRELCGVTLKEVGKVSKFVGDNHYDCPKILTVVPAEKAKEYAEELRAMNLPGVAIVRSHDYFVEAVPTGGGKGNAIVKIAEYYGVDLSEVIAVGDQENDISMVVKAGLGCCVANAIDELKAVSYFVENDCDNDAIAQIIDTFTKD